MILCACIKIYINKTNQNINMLGIRHSDIFENLSKLGFSKNDYNIIEQGFIDTEGNFLDRHDAWREADRCGQLSMTVKEMSNTKGTLYSEDLY